MSTNLNSVEGINPFEVSIAIGDVLGLNEFDFRHNLLIEIISNTGINELIRAMTATDDIEAANRLASNAIISSVSALDERLKPYQERIREKILLEYSKVDGFGHYRRVMTESLSELGIRSVNIISVGCGEGSVEGGIAEDLRAQGIDSTWIGIDHDRTLPPQSIFRQEGNHLIPPPEDATNYIDHIRKTSPGALQEGSPTFVMFNLSAHHIPLTPQQILERTQGAQAIVFEELVDEKLYQDPLNRIVYIAYDVLANYSFNPAWIQAAVEDPRQFTIRHLSFQGMQDSGFDIRHTIKVPLASQISFGPTNRE
jgi:hypothetical protein